MFINVRLFSILLLAFTVQQTNSSNIYLEFAAGFIEEVVDEEIEATTLATIENDISSAESDIENCFSDFIYGQQNCQLSGSGCSESWYTAKALYHGAKGVYEIYEAYTSASGNSPISETAAIEDVFNYFGFGDITQVFKMATLAYDLYQDWDSFISDFKVAKNDWQLGNGKSAGQEAAQIVSTLRSTYSSLSSPLQARILNDDAQNNSTNVTVDDKVAALAYHYFLQELTGVEQDLKQLAPYVKDSGKFFKNATLDLADEIHDYATLNEVHLLLNQAMIQLNYLNSHLKNGSDVDQDDVYKGFDDVNSLKPNQMFENVTDNLHAALEEFKHNEDVHEYGHNMGKIAFQIAPSLNQQEDSATYYIGNMALAIISLISLLSM